jgi:Domain of Unknown Function (DUF928)
MLKLIRMCQKKLVLLLLILVLFTSLISSGEASQRSDKELFVDNLRVENLSEVRFHLPAEQPIYLAQQNRRNWNPPTGKQPSRKVWAWLIGLIRRGSCRNLESPLTVLLPLTQEAQQGFKDAFGLAVSNHPTFWIYIPQLPSGIETAEFTIQDQDGSDLLEKPVPIDLLSTILPVSSSNNFRQPIHIVLPKTLQDRTNPQIIGISLPLEVKSLLSGKFYHWYFSVTCDSRRPSRNLSVDGWIGIIQPGISLANEIANAKNDLERSQIYAREGIWYDTVTMLATLRCKEPENSILSNEWSSLLKDENIRLNQVADNSAFIETCRY